MVSIYNLEIAVMSHLNILPRRVLKVGKNTQKKCSDSNNIYNNHLQSTRQKSYYYINNPVDQILKTVATISDWNLQKRLLTNARCKELLLSQLPVVHQN